MTDRKYKVSQWYGWTGGECPVPGESRVGVMFNDRCENFDLRASRWNWGRNGTRPIIAFCVTEYPDEVVTRQQSISVHDVVDFERINDATCTYRNGKLVEVHWKDESDE